MIKRGVLYLLSVICLGLWWACISTTEPDSSFELEIGQFHDLEYPVIAPADDALTPDSVRSAYREDAARLTVRIMHEAGEEATTVVEIPEGLGNSLYAALIHIYQEEQLAAWDSVVNMYNIHTFANPELNTLLMSLDSTKQWTQRWWLGDTQTGNDTIDYLMSTYEMELYRHDINPPGLPDVVMLHSPQPLNLSGLAYWFALVDGVIWAEPNAWAGDGPEIIAQAGTDHWLLTYSLGWGDCPAGCIDRHFWLFKVSTIGEVTYLGSSGTPIPTGMIN